MSSNNSEVKKQLEEPSKISNGTLKDFHWDIKVRFLKTKLSVLFIKRY